MAKKANANKKAKRSALRTLKTREKNGRELEKFKRDPKYKPKIKKKGGKR